MTPFFHTLFRGNDGNGVAAVLMALAVLLLIAAPALADDATENRLRDALRQAITQQRALEDSQAQLQAKNTEAAKQIEALQAQLDALQKNAQAPKSDSAAAERMAAEFNRRLAEQNTQAQQLSETLEKWKAAYTQAAEVARAKEAERVRLAGQVDGLEKRGQACEARNEALFKAGNQILDHLKAISVAEAMEAHEPFVGLKRVELQTLAQDDEDKLLDQRVEAGR